MDYKQLVLNNEKKTKRINLRITESQKEFIKKKNLSYTRIFEAGVYLLMKDKKR